jgi:hypothetical protein
MSNNTCNKTSNNKYFDSPARMDDGRAFTDYRQSNSIDNMIRVSNNISSNYEYRQFLINNAKKIININNEYTLSKVGNGSCNYQEVPFETECVFTPVSPTCKTINPNGIGVYNRAKVDKPGK